MSFQEKTPKYQEEQFIKDLKTFKRTVSQGAVRQKRQKLSTTV